MGTRERKLRDRTNREALILAEARRLLVRDGYLGFSMDALAEAVEYSKPTLYTHFASKEDLVLAVANDSLRQRVALFVRAATFRGRSREKFCAIGVADEIFVHCYREHFAVETMMFERSMADKVTAERRAQSEGQGRLCFGTMAAIVGEGVAAGDLDPRRASADDVCHAVCSMSFGVHLRAMTGGHNAAELADIYTRLRRNCHLYLDGVGWRPLFRDWDYGATTERILTEVFAEEADALPPALRSRHTAFAPG